MSKIPKRRKTPARKTSEVARLKTDFDQVLALIDASRTRAVAAANTALIDLYWQIGEHISRRIAAAGWGEGTVKQLADYIRRRQPNARGFSRQNLWRMRQFYDTYLDQPNLSAMLRELPWTHNLMILGKSKRDEEREFYIRLCIGQRWTSRQLERQMNSALFERTVLSPPRISPLLAQLHPTAGTVFKDAYLLEFLDLPADHAEADLQRALVEQLKQFLIELGRDFCFVGSQYPLQVGGRDFSLDLLFFNRALNCLVAIDLKIEEFQPEHLGKMEFYLESLDRDVKKPHEGPSVGVLLCATKDNEVVEYALSRAASPALIASYETRLPDKRLLESKLHEFYQLAISRAASTADTATINDASLESSLPAARKRPTARRRTQG